MKQKVLGTYELGDEYVEQIAMPDESGGEFYFQPEKNHIARIKVGLDFHTLAGCVSVLLHETLEFASARHGVRFMPCRSAHVDISDFLFVFNHQQFASICRDAAMFVAEALPALATEYRKKRAARKS